MITLGFPLLSNTTNPSSEFLILILPLNTVLLAFRVIVPEAISIPVLSFKSLKTSALMLDLLWLILELMVSSVTIFDSIESAFYVM